MAEPATAVLPRRRARRGQAAAQPPGADHLQVVIADERFWVTTRLTGLFSCQPETTVGISR
eukprot:607761-Pleurochrysis_carterae.AAC.3